MNDGGRRQPGARMSPLRTWLDHHVFSLLASLGRIAARPGSTALTVAVMALALALPLGLWLALSNVERFSGAVQQSRTISLFLKPELTLARAEALAQALGRRADVLEVMLKTPEQGLQELRRRSGLAEAIAVLDDNPLPSVLMLTPRGDERALAQALSTLAEVDQVQYDSQWRRRLEAWLGLGRRVAGVLAVSLSLGALLVAGNTVRLDIQARSEEIGILQLLGASDGFIRRPFLYLGLWYGAFAGALAIGVLAVIGAALRQPVSALAASYGSGFMLRGFTPAQALLVVVGAAALGWLGAGIVSGHFLRRTRPGVP